MNIDRIVLTTFAGYYFTQILCLRSIQQYAAGFPIDIIIDDFDIQHWPTYPKDCEQYVRKNFPDLDIRFYRFSEFPGMERVETGGWFRQQLVKLYLDRFVSGNRWLLVDADVVFREPPDLDIISAVVRHEFDPIGAGNRLYIEKMLACTKPWVGNQQQYWCLSGVPFRLIQRDLLESLRAKIFEVNNKDLFDLHVDMFQQQSLVAFDREGKKMIMSEFQLIEIFRNQYYHSPLPIIKQGASDHEHSSIKDWNFDRQYFVDQAVSISNRDWELSQIFGANHV